MFVNFQKNLPNFITLAIILWLPLFLVMGMDSTIEVTSSSNFSGSYGLRVQLDGGSPAFVGDNSPAGETRYRCRFYLRLDDLEMAEADAFDLFTGANQAGETQFRIILARQNGIHQLNMEVSVNEGDSVLSFANGSVVVPNGYHSVEIDWASGPGTGHLVVWLDGVRTWQVTDLNNNSASIETVFLGAVADLDLSTRGGFDIDAFQSQRQCYVGLWDCDSGCQYPSDRLLWPEVSVTDLAYLLNDPCFSPQ